MAVLQQNDPQMCRLCHYCQVGWGKVVRQLLGASQQASSPAGRPLFTSGAVPSREAYVADGVTWRPIRFTVHSDAPIRVVFEPTAEDYRLAAGESIEVEWFDDGNSTGGIRLAGGDLVIWSPGMTMRAWDAAGVPIETMLGPP